MKEEQYEVRCNMAKIHKSYLSLLGHAVKDKEYVEASWLCYAIIEQRTQRIVEKYISQCPKQRRSKEDRPTSLTTKLNCIGKLAKKQYGLFAEFDKKLIREILKW